MARPVRIILAVSGTSLIFLGMVLIFGVKGKIVVNTEEFVGVHASRLRAGDWFVLPDGWNGELTDGVWWFVEATEGRYIQLASADGPSRVYQLVGDPVVWLWAGMCDRDETQLAQLLTNN